MELQLGSVGTLDGGLVHEHLNRCLRPNKELSKTACAVTQLFISTRNIRLEGAPTEEQTQNICDVVKRHVNMGVPIPVLIAAGPKKTKHGESIDLAEFCMIKILKGLQESVQEYYAPGFYFMIRLEDCTGIYLEGQEAFSSMLGYMSDFKKLIRVLGCEDFIKTFREMEKVKPQTFIDTSEKFAEDFYVYLRDSNTVHEDDWADLTSYRKLEEQGWKGLIPAEMRQHYMRKYAKLYPDGNEEFHLASVSRYFGSALAKRELNISGRERFPFGFLEISFTGRIPGMPKGLQSTRVYYRTVPMKDSKRHMPCWRCKGVLKQDKGKVRVCLLSWKGELSGLTPYSFTVRNQDTEVRVKADALLS